MAGRQGGQSALGVGEARRRIVATVLVAQRLKDEHAAPRQQGRVDLERRVLGRRADQGDGPVLDGRQEGVLLGLVEAMDLVDEEDRAAVLDRRFPGLVDGRANLPHAEPRPPRGR